MNPLIPPPRTQSRVVDTATRPRREVSAWVRYIERCMAAKPRRQIGVGDNEPAECYRIRLAVVDDLILWCQRVFFIRDVVSAELPFELQTQHERALRL